MLLRNLGALPLHKGQKVAYIGAFADHPRYSAGHPCAPQVTSAIDAAVLHDRKIQYIEGFPADRDQRDEAEFLRAVAAAEAADAAVIFAGLPECAELAAADRRHMRLPECQNNLIARVAAVQKNTVVVLHTSGPVECPWADDVSSVLCMYLAGEGLGEATDALLWGDADPCGRLPETWPLRLEDTPCYLDFPGDGVTADYREGVYVGYRWYDARKMPVRWPFGHGLSYTGYVYRGAALNADTLTPGGTVTARVTVKNQRRDARSRGRAALCGRRHGRAGAGRAGAPGAAQVCEDRPAARRGAGGRLYADAAGYKPLQPRAARLVRRAGPVRNTHRAFEPGHPRGAGLTVCGRKKFELIIKEMQLYVYQDHRTEF